MYISNRSMINRNLHCQHIFLAIVCFIFNFYCVPQLEWCLGFKKNGEQKKKKKNKPENENHGVSVSIEATHVLDLHSMVTVWLDLDKKTLWLGLGPKLLVWVSENIVVCFKIICYTYIFNIWTHFLFWWSTVQHAIDVNDDKDM